MKSIIRVTLVALAAALSIFVNASPVTWVEILPDNSMQAGLLDGAGKTVNFTGEIQYRKLCFGIPLNLTCNLSFETLISDSSGTHMDISFAGLTASGAGYCNMSMTGTSVASIAHEDLPTLLPPPAKQLLDTVDFTLPSFSLVSSCGSCTGNLDGIYTNIGGGTVWLNGTLASGLGDCYVTGYGNASDAEYMFWH